MHRTNMDKDGTLCLPQQAMELLDIKAGDRLKLLLVGKEIHIHKCKLALHSKNMPPINLFESAVPQSDPS